MPYIYVFIMCASIYFFWRFSAVFKKSVFFFIFTLALPLKNAYCYFNKGDKQMSYIDSLRFKFLCHSKVKLIDRHKWDIGFAHSDMTRRVNNYHQSANIWGPYRGCVTIEEDSAVYENRRADWSEAYSRKAGTLPSPSFEVIKQTDRRVFIGEERV